MWTRFTPEADAALITSHTACTRVEVRYSGLPVYVLDVVDGHIDMDVDRPVRANLACTLVDPTGTLTRGDVGDLLNAYECEIAPFRGVVVPSTTVAATLTPNEGFGAQGFGSSGFGGVDAAFTSVTSWRQEFAPLGVFRLTGKTVSDGPNGLTITLDGQDRAMTYQTPMDSPLFIPSGTPIETAIRLLLARVNPSVILQGLQTGFVTGPLLYKPDIDVWQAAQELAASVGAVLFHDRTGVATLALMGPASDTPVAAYEERSGLLLSVDRAEDSDTICNVVVARSASGLIEAVAEDTNPASPTYVRGKYPRKVKTITNQHFGSVDQAMQAATTRLAYELGRVEQVTFEAVPDPRRDLQEVVTVHRPAAGLGHRALSIATLNMPLKIAEGDRGIPMRVGCRRSVLSADGQVLPLSEVA